jgi:prephenate dehydrogenase
MNATPSETPRFKQATIAGVGLLGASLGLALRERNLADRVVGLGRNKARLERARLQGALDDWSVDLDEACAEADLVVLCGPVSVILEQLPGVLARVPQGALVTDVGSTKNSIVECAARYSRDGVAFVGSHPMAGSEKSGAEFARADLYKNATVILTPDQRTGDEALERVRRLWKALETRVLEMLPGKHDRVLALVSHLPHLVAASLVAQAELGAGVPPQLLRKIAGPGFRDTTRIAMGSAEMWLDIFLDNDRAMIESIDRLVQILTDLRSVIERADRRELSDFLEHTAEFRREYFQENKNEGE